MNRIRSLIEGRLIMADLIRGELAGTAPEAETLKRVADLGRALVRLADEAEAAASSNKILAAARIQ